MTPADALGEIHTLAETIQEHLDSLDVETRYVEEEGPYVAHETHTAIADELAGIRRAIAAIRLQIRLADEADTPKAAEQAVPQ